MKEINEIEFLRLLTSVDDFQHKDLIVNFENDVNVDLDNVTFSNNFKNCKFQGKRVDFINSNLTEESVLTHCFGFDDCEFQNDVYFKDCYLQEIKFSNISKPIKKLHLAPKKLGWFSFSCIENLEQKDFIEIDIIIHNCENVQVIDFINLNSTGNLLISGCKKINYLKIHNSAFKTVGIKNCNFSNDFQFSQNLTERSYFKYNKFKKSIFTNTNFGIEAQFLYNDFLGTTLFDRLKNLSKTRLEFKNCNFEKYTHFNNSSLYKLHLDTTKFKELSSFQDLELNSIFLDRTIFEKIAFFDDIQINSFKDCNKRTIRNIKQQLLRSDNKIDYDAFRAHELNSYKQEIASKLKKASKFNRKRLSRDLMILRVSSFYSNNGTDWVKAIKRTLFLAVLFYSIFYGFHNSTRQINLFETSGYREYFIGLFRYFILTDFHNPLTNSREYLKNLWEWIPFVFGKIFIGIGIYEVLVSFRKFRK